MPFDGITAFAVQCELEKQLLGGRIDKIYQPEADEVILNIRSQGKMQRLLLTANARNAAAAAHVLHAVSQAFYRRKDPEHRPASF